jgi:hypothetical protein
MSRTIPRAWAGAPPVVEDAGLARARWRAWCAYPAVALLSLVAVVLVMQLWRANSRLPFAYLGEALYNGLLIKGILEQGWHLSNPALGAPTGLDLRDVPMSDNNLHFALIRPLALVTSNYARAMNAYFLLTFPLTALSALYVFRRFGLAAWPALCGSLLYTFLPFHFARGEHLGVIGSLGFLALLGCFLLGTPGGTRRGESADVAHRVLLRDVSILNLSAVLLGTIGGFGSLVALVISSKIRAYNRISIYIAFFSLFRGRGGGRLRVSSARTGTRPADGVHGRPRGAARTGPPRSDEPTGRPRLCEDRVRVRERRRLRPAGRGGDAAGSDDLSAAGDLLSRTSLGQRDARLRSRARISARAPPAVELWRLRIGPAGRALSKTISIPPGDHALNFRCTAPRMMAPADRRQLVFRVVSFRAVPVAP